MGYKKVFVLMLFMLMFSVPVLCGCSNGTEQAAGYRQISAEQAAELMRQESDCIILDVRTVEEYNTGHIENAICVPNENINSGEIKELPDKQQLILVYCRSGNRSKQAAKKLVSLGYTNIVEFGGIIDWQGKITEQ